MDRFWSKVNKQDGCWVWTASLDTSGYGRFSLLGRQVSAHRLAYEMEVDEIPAGHQIDHLCRNRACVNPAHLEPVTQQENIRRGNVGGHAQRAITHCPGGHPYDEEHMQIVRRSSGKVERSCRTCANERRRRRYRERVAP